MLIFSLNKNLDLNIQKYVTVSFSVVADIVDMLGGIYLYVTPEEAAAVNGYIVETARVCGKEANFLKWGGHQTLDGVQATTYARIRKGVGDDYGRTARQRLVIEKIFEKMLESDIGTINKIIDVVLPQVSTNLTNAEIMSYAAGVFGYSIGDNTGFPFKSNTANVDRRGSCVYATTLQSNVAQLHEFLYGTVDYQPSSTVKNISNEIAYLVANNKVTSSSSSDDDETESTTDTPTTDNTTTPDGGNETQNPGTGEGTQTPGTGTQTPGTGEGTQTPGTGDGGGTTPPSTGGDSGTPPPSTEGDSGTTPPSTGGDSGTTPPSTGGTESSGGETGTTDGGTGASVEGE